jgi:EpsI family protein
MIKRAILAAVLMVAAATTAKILTPQPVPVVAGQQVKLDRLVPKAFGQWRMDENAGSGAIVNPSLQDLLNKLYADQLSRVYISPTGQRVMLSLAYGQNQNRDLQVHKPEVCYVAQGFQLKSSEKTVLNSPFGGIPAMRLVTAIGERNEPVTYWIRMGDKIIRGWLEQNVARISAGFHGQIPDGLLVRVSTVEADNPTAFATQEKFLSDMMLAVDEKDRAMFIGQATNLIHQ